MMEECQFEKISILLAVYHPNHHWLKEQLVSLESQTYPNIELDIVDDGPDDPVGEAFFTEHLRRIPFRYSMHCENQGSDKTFEELVQNARGSYIAFCDQDDRWDPDKLKKLHEILHGRSAQLAYCNLSAIDGDGAVLADDIRKIRTRDVFLEGESISEQLLIKSCIYGSSLLMRAETAKEALPLPAKMGFDHWFALWAAVRGEIVFLNEYLVEHRIHGENQSKPLRGIETKQDYWEQRIVALQKRNAECIIRLNQAVLYSNRTEDVLSKARETQIWAEARNRWLNGDLMAFHTFLKGRKLSPKAFLFELIMPFLPEKLFQIALKIIA